MKREFLEGLDLGEGAGKLPKSAVDAIMAEYGKDFAEKDNTISTLTTERDGLRAQLTDTNATIQSYKDMDIDGIKKSATDWEVKYNTDTQALRDQLAAAEYGHAVENAVSGMKFSSASARKAFLADLTEKKLPVQDGKLLGLEDFAESYRETDPDAFVDKAEEKRARFTAPLGGGDDGNQRREQASMKDAIAARLKSQVEKIT